MTIHISVAVIHYAKIAAVILGSASVGFIVGVRFASQAMAAAMWGGRP